LKRISVTSLFVLTTLFLAACSGQGATLQQPGAQPPANQASSAAIQPIRAISTVAQVPVTSAASANLLAAYEGTLADIYTAVSPSVVNIHVVMNSSANSGLPAGHPPIPGFGQQQPPDLNQAPSGEALGSGFVWDQAGHIVTNNHVVADATSIDVTFSDGTNLPAKLVSTDPDSDLAVIKVDAPANLLQPVQMGDSKALKVGQLAIAIGNPFGLEGTMTTGIISAMGRTMPANENAGPGATYSIPDIIQTDASINPGNSGGVLLNDQGQVVGVTFAIESNTRSNSGIGFVIPASIVEKVVPALIEKGGYQHSYLGISGTSLTPSLAKAMNLDSAQRGALVETVAGNGPAAKAGLKASDQQVTLDGQQTQVGGDVITAIDGQVIKGMDDVIAYLSANTSVGDSVTLTVLRDGKPLDVKITLGARPNQPAQQSLTVPVVPTLPTLPKRSQPNQQAPDNSGGAWLGISGGTLTADLAQAMSLDSSQQGVLIGDVAPNGPADKAGLQGSSQSVDINGQQVNVGGDIITALDGKQVTSINGLIGLLNQYKSGDQVTVSVLRDGQSMDLQVTLGQRPSSN
jgi:serine protease Do